MGHARITANLDRLVPGGPSRRGGDDAAAGGRRRSGVRRRPAPARRGGLRLPGPLPAPPRAAGRRAVVDGQLQCGYHGWRFDAEGRCVDIPSLGAGGTPPPRADLAMPWAVEERHGWVWLAPERTATPAPPRPTADRRPEPAPAPTPARAGVRQPRPVARARLAPRRPLPRAPAGRLAAGPPAGPHLDAAPHGRRSGGGSPGVRRPGAARRRLARPGRAGRRPPGPARGRRPALRRAAGCRRCAPSARRARWPTTSSTSRTSPFVHGATFGAEDRPEVPVYDVVPEPGGFRSTQEQWCENPTDPEVARGGRPLRQRRRATYVYRAPFAPGVAGVPRHRGDDDDPVPAAARGRRLHADLHLPVPLGRATASRCPRPPSSPRRWPSTGGCWRRTSGSWAAWPAPACRWTCARSCTSRGPAGRRAAPGALRLRDGGGGGSGPPDARQSPGSSAPHAGQRVGGSSSASRPHAGQTRRSQQAGSPPSSSAGLACRRPLGHDPPSRSPGDVTDSTRCRAGTAGMLGTCRRPCSAAPP